MKSVCVGRGGLLIVPLALSVLSLAGCGMWIDQKDLRVAIETCAEHGGIKTIRDGFLGVGFRVVCNDETMYSGEAPK